MIPEILIKSPVTTDGIQTLAPVNSEIKILPPVTVQQTTTTGAALWTGEGPPNTILGSQVGDEYLDVLTGTLYKLGIGA